MLRISPCDTIAFLSRALTSQRGSILPYLSVAVGIVALIALTLMTGLGDVILHRRDASNAADAAALAAAEAWGHSIESTYGNATKSRNEHDFWGSVGKGLGSFAGPTTKRAAEHYAKLNGATVTSYSVDETRGTVTVSVRTDSTITYTDKKMTATSTAQVVFDRGACLTGGKVGFEMDGKCMTQPNSHQPTPHKSPSPSAPPQATPTATPFKAPTEMRGSARITARLV